MNNKVVQIIVTMVLSCTFLQAVVMAEETADALWRHDAGGDITYLQLVDDTLLLSGTKRRLECLNRANGDVLWEAVVEDSVIGWNAGHITGTPYLLMLQAQSRNVRASKFQGGGLQIVKNNRLTVMDMRTGESLWRSKASRFHSVVGYYPTPDSTKLILITADSLRVKAINCIDFKSNELLWVNDTIYSQIGPELSSANNLDSLNVGEQQPIFDSDSTMITFLSRGLVRKWNWLTGAVIWKAELSERDVAPISDGYMQMKLSVDEDGVYVPVNKYLFYLDNNTGEVIWQSPKMYGNVYQVELTESGLLVRGGYMESGRGGYKDYMMLLDPENGEYKWEKQITKFKTTRTSNYVIFGKAAYVYSDRNMYAISIIDGTYFKIASKIDVLGFIRLFKFEDQIRLVSGETVALMNTDATMVFNSTHKLPKSVGFWSAVGTIVSIAAIVVVASQYASGGYRGGGGLIYVPPVSYGLTHYNEIAVASDSSICMVTYQKKGFKDKLAMIRVRFSDGEIVSSMFINEKRPKFTFSESLSALYIVEDDSKIAAFAF